MNELKLNWIITNYCNFNCSYCPEFLKDGRLPCPSLDQLIVACQNIIDQTHKFNFQSVSIQFDGGEPSTCEPLKNLLLQDLDSILKYRLNSNGSADFEWWKSIKDKILSLDLTYHLECDFNHFQSVVKLFLDNNKEVYIKVPMPVEQDKWLHAYIAFKNLKKICKNVDMKMLYANFTKGNNSYMAYTSAQWDIYFRLNGLKYDQTLPVDSEEYKKVNHMHDYYGTMCWAGTEQAIITYFGDVFRGWCKANKPLGNVFNNTFELYPVPLPCPKLQCVNGFDRAARKSKKSWGMT